MSDSDLLSSDSEYDEIEEFEKPFWYGFNFMSYKLALDLHKSAFLIDFLEDLYIFKLENEKIIIYEKKNNGIEEIIKIDKLIYFLHIDLYNMSKEASGNNNIIINILSCFSQVETIHKAVENMKIYLKYHKKDINNENNEEKENKISLMKVIKTKKINNNGLNMLKPTIL